MISTRKDNQVGQATTAMSVLDIKANQSGIHDSRENNFRAKKVARLSSEGATIGAAIVEAENSLEVEVSSFCQTRAINLN